MDEFDIPIFKKTYELYKTVNQYRTTVPKQDRYTVWQKCENTVLAVLEGILLASQISKQEKLPVLEKTSIKINLFRVFLRLAHDTKLIDDKKHAYLQENTDEIGRMLGGWIKQTKS